MHVEFEHFPNVHAVNVIGSEDDHEWGSACSIRLMFW